MRARISIPLLLTLVCGQLSAAHFRVDTWLAEGGVLESVRIDPVLPAMGEGFKVRLAGSWPEASPDGFCFAPAVVDSVTVHAGNRVQLISNLQHDPAYCDQPPAHWDIEVNIPAGAWDAVSEQGVLLIEHLFSSGINQLTGINQYFDMHLGTHQVPAFLGSGFWISTELPFEGLMVEQQAGRVLFYGLAYDRDTANGDDGEPVWQMLSGDMYGNSVLGRGYRYDWPIGEDSLPVPAPTHDELLTVNDSGAIIVNDYNHIRAFTKLENGNFARYADFHRYYFGLDPSRAPVYVPPLSGSWTLHGFDEQEEIFSEAMVLRDAVSPASNQYRFDSADDNWSVLCTVVPPGTGNCSLQRVAGSAKFDFPLSAFQGNLARGTLQDSNGDQSDGVLVRQPWRLPVLDVQAN